MQNNFYVLHQLTKALADKIVDSRLIECFSQQKEELVIQFLSGEGENFNIKAHLRSNFSCLSFPESFQRAKRNSVDLFSELKDQKVVSVNDHNNDRSFNIEFQNGYSLLFKLHGNRSNIILLNDNVPTKLFKNKLANDLNLIPHELAKTVDLTTLDSKEGVLDVQAIPTLDKRLREHLYNLLTNSEDKLVTLNEFIDRLKKQPTFFVVNVNDRIKFSLFEEGQVLLETKDVIEGLNFFFNKKIRDESLTMAKAKLRKDLHEQIKRTGTYLIKIKAKLNQLEGDESYRQFGDILMANLNYGNLNTDKIELLNFYTNKAVKIKVNPSLSIQKNAEKYYRKSKNLGIEIDSLKKNIRNKEQLLSRLNSELEKVETIDSVKELSKSIKPVEKEQKHDFKEVLINGFVILIGKNAKQNDLLTLKFAKPNDTWLHAKDVTGSHVVIKELPGQQIPEYIIEEAASYAAFYSKRKNDTLCPVMVTKKKYVRKKKGLPPGAVIVEKERVILVEPSPVS